MLTAKQEQFALSIAEGTTQASAYRQAYDASGVKDGTVWSEAARLLRRTISDLHAVQLSQPPSRTLR